MRLSIAAAFVPLDNHLGLRCDVAWGGRRSRIRTVTEPPATLSCAQLRSPWRGEPLQKRANRQLFRASSNWRICNHRKCDQNWSRLYLHSNQLQGFNFMKTVSYTAVAITLLFINTASPSFSQVACPAGLTYAGSASVEHDTGQGNALDMIRVEIPHNRDRSYVQGNATGKLVGTDSSNQQAQTPWNGQHGIRGISLEAVGNYYYALGVDVNGRNGRPRVVAELDANGEISHEYLEIGAYCGPGGNGEGCTATIRVCYKPA